MANEPKYYAAVDVNIGPRRFLRGQELVGVRKSQCENMVRTRLATLDDGSGPLNQLAIASEQAAAAAKEEQREARRIAFTDLIDGIESKDDAAALAVERGVTLEPGTLEELKAQLAAELDPDAESDDEVLAADDDAGPDALLAQIDALRKKDDAIALGERLGVTLDRGSKLGDMKDRLADEVLREDDDESDDAGETGDDDTGDDESA